MATINFNLGLAFIFLLCPLFLQFCLGESELELNYYKVSCPRAEEIIKDQVSELYEREGNIAVSFLRSIFHDCMVEGCDASLLLDTRGDILSEKKANSSFGMRYFKYFDTIKTALERECPDTVSCADILVLSARDAVLELGGPSIEMKTGRKDSNKSYLSIVDQVMPNQDSNMSFALDAFEKIGVNTEAFVGLLGSHTVGRAHCVSFVKRLYPTVDPTLNSKYAEYLMDRRCNEDESDKFDQKYAKNDPSTPMVFDNMYYKNLLDGLGLMRIDEELVSDNRTNPFVVKMAGDNGYFFKQFSRGFQILSENNPLTDGEGEIRKNCRRVNSQRE